MLCVGAVVAAGAGGCRSTNDDAGASAAVFAEVERIELPAAETRAVRGDWPRRVVYAPIGEISEARLVIEREPDDTGVQTRSSINEGEEAVQRRQTFAVRDDGAVVLVEEVNHAEGVEVVFDPPLVVLPARLEVGAAIECEGRMTVHPLGDRSRVRAKGTYTETGRCEGAVTVRTPAGEFVAWKLVSELRAELGPSRVQNETELWISPRAGIVAERRRERTLVFGVPVRNNAESWVAESVPVSAAADQMGR